jgi:hypothetical protein
MENCKLTKIILNLCNLQITKQELKQITLLVKNPIYCHILKFACILFKKAKLCYIKWKNKINFFL